MKRSSSSRVFLIAIMVAAGVLTSSSAMAAVDMFLKITGIKGEVLDTIHRDEIEVLAWSWGTSTGTARTVKSALPAVCVQDLSFTKVIDVASPQLILNSVTGVVAPEAILTIRKSGRDQQEYLILRMSNVTVVSYSTGIGGLDERLSENVALHFESMRGEYRRQKADGTLDTPVFFDVSGGSCR